MSTDAGLQLKEQHILLSLISSSADCDTTPKLDVRWSKHLYNKLQVLEEDFVSMGFVPYLRKPDPHTVIIDFNSLTNDLYELFERHLQCLNAREDASINIRRLTADLEHLRKMHDRCKDELQSTRNAVHQAKERERWIGVEKATLANQLRASKEALRRQQSDSQMHSAHIQRKLNKIEKENASLKDRLNTLLAKSAATRRFPSAHETVKSAELDKLNNQLDQTRSKLERLRNRENELFQENRELRDLVSVLSSRILLFIRHLRRKRQQRQRLGVIPEAQLEVDGEQEETSLDCGSDAEGSAENSLFNTSSDSLSEAKASVQSQFVDTQQERRQSANLRHLLLEMPFHLVRDQLVCRVHRLSRRLWREIKSVGSVGGESGVVCELASSTGEAFVGRHLQEQLSRWKLTLAQCEEEWKENDLLIQSSTCHTPLSRKEVLAGDVLLPEAGVADAESCQYEAVVFKDGAAPQGSLTDGVTLTNYEGIVKAAFLSMPRGITKNP